MSSKAKPKYYWDANCFLGILNGEEEKVAHCVPLYDEAKNGKLTIVTSTLTFVECAGGNIELARLSASGRMQRLETLKALFENPWIIPVQVDLIVAREAQRLIHWVRGELGMSLPNDDAIHLASALRTGIDRLHTYDPHLLPLDGRTPPGNSKALSVVKPIWTGQKPMTLPE